MSEHATATLATHVTDMHALVNHGLQAIDRQARTLNGEVYPQALSAVREFQRTLRHHAKLLDARGKKLGGRANQPLKDLKDMVTRVTGFVAGVMSVVRPAMAARAIRDDYTFLSHLAISYLMLFTCASALGDDETAGLAEQGYRDAARLVMQIDRIMPSRVLQTMKRSAPTHELEFVGAVHPAKAAAGRRAPELNGRECYSLRPVRRGLRRPGPAGRAFAGVPASPGGGELSIRLRS
jgi:hypothetical protein